MHFIVVVIIVVVRRMRYVSFPLLVGFIYSSTRTRTTTQFFDTLLYLFFEINILPSSHINPIRRFRHVLYSGKR